MWFPDCNNSPVIPWNSTDNETGQEKHKRWTTSKNKVWNKLLKITFWNFNIWNWNSEDWNYLEISNNLYFATFNQCNKSISTITNLAKTEYLKVKIYAMKPIIKNHFGSVVELLTGTLMQIWNSANIFVIIWKY